MQACRINLLVHYSIHIEMDLYAYIDACILVQLRAYILPFLSHRYKQARRLLYCLNILGSSNVING